MHANTSDRLLSRGLPDRRPFCRRPAQRRVAADVEDFVGKLTVPGDAGQHQRSDHGRERRHSLLARGLAGNAGHLIGHHVDHLLELGGEGLAGLRALAGDFRAQRRHRAAMAGVVAVHRRQV